MNKTYSFKHVLNLHSLANERDFLQQVESFAFKVRSWTQQEKKRLEEGGVPNSEFGNQILNDAFKRYHLRCRFFEVCAHHMSEEKITVERGLILFRWATEVLLMITPEYEKYKNRERLAKAYEIIARINPRYPLMMVVGYFENWSPLSPFDFVAWNSVIDTGHPILIWKRTEIHESNPIHSSGENPFRLTKSQEAALERLKFFQRLKTMNATVEGVQTRPVPLIVGPSGSGKSALVQFFSRRGHYPLLELNFGNWIVTGARTEPYTMNVILKFVAENKEGVLFIDELDKFCGKTDWSSAIQQEIYSLLDGRLNGFNGWSGEIIKRLQSQFLIVGAGTWQELYKEQAKSIGFKSTPGSDEGTSLLDGQTAIPDELLFRFNEKVIFLNPIGPEEIQERIVNIRKQLDMPPLQTRELVKVVEAAVVSRKNTRWLEAYLANLLWERSRNNLPLMDEGAAKQNTQSSRRASQ